MERFSFEVRGAAGLHARPAADLVACAQQFACNIELSLGSEHCDAKRIFGVLGLDAGQGDTVVVTCEGSDEHEARMTLEKLAQEL